MNSEGFAISCTTCGVSLKVQDAALVGQILGCPKCGSMVLVEPPESAEPTPSAEPQAETLPPAPEKLPTAQLAGFPLQIVFAASVTGILLIGSLSWLVWGRGRTADVPASPAMTAVAESAKSATAASVDDNRETLSPDETTDAPIPITDDQETVVATPEPSISAPDSPPMSAPDPAEHVLPLDVASPSLATDAGNSPAGLVSPSPTAEVDPANARTDGNESLANIARLLSGGTELAPSDPAVEASTPAARAVGVTTLANTATPGAAYAQTAGGNTDADFGPSIAQAQFDKVPLIDFCRTLQQLAGVPIQIDPAALRQSANVLETPVSVSGRDANAMELLRRALEPIRMIPLRQGKIIRISSPRLEDQRVGQLSLFVGDLQSGRGRSLSIEDLVTTLVQPGSWGADGIRLEVKGERLNVQHTHAARIEIVVLLEKLRAARKLRPRKRLPARYTNLESRWSRVERYLQRPLKLDVWDERPLPQVLEALEAASGMRIIADWSELAASGVTPRTTLSLYIRERQASDVFAELQRALADAVLVPVSGDAVQLTTDSARQREPYIEFYALDQLGADARRRIMQVGERAASVIDPVSDVAMVLAPADVQRSLLP